ncbi:MAG TPA: hypothetical protein VLC52_01240, partial [Anaerolineae bacterium]|nr:hypothetical protein [Anaerolineae bacterium]
MKKFQMELDKLPNGTYYYCGNCEEWFGQRRPGPDHQCRACGWRWENARGVFETEKTATSWGTGGQGTSKQDTSGCESAVVVALILLVA